MRNTLVLVIMLTHFCGCRGTEPELANPFPAGSLSQHLVFWEYQIYRLEETSTFSKEHAVALLKKHLPYVAITEKPIPDTSCAMISFVPDAQETLPPPSLEMLRYVGKGLSREEAIRLQTSESAVVVNFMIIQEDLEKAVHDSAQFLAQLATENHGVIWDQMTRQCFGGEAWEDLRLKPSSKGFYDLQDHITYHAYKDGDFIRAITLGMEKFGLPDIEVSDFLWSDSTSVGNTINLLAQQLYEGGEIETAGQFTLSPSTLKHPEVRKRIRESLFENAADSITITIAQGVWDAGDPENRILEIVFPSKGQQTVQERMEEQLSRLWGWEDSVATVSHDDKILEASHRAKEKLPELRAAFLAGLAPGEYYMVKAPFKTQDGGNEWMWVEVVQWENPESISGILKNQPRFIKDLMAGSEVTVKTSEVFDYIHTLPSGEQHGNETSELIMQAQQ